MARIQDIRQFEELICDTVNEYLSEKECYQHPVLAIYREKGKLQVVIEDLEKLHLPKDSETYSIENFIFKNEDGSFEPEYDAIEKVVNEWLFIEY